MRKLGGNIVERVPATRPPRRWRRKTASFASKSAVDGLPGRHGARIVAPVSIGFETTTARGAGEASMRSEWRLHAVAAVLGALAATPAVAQGDACKQRGQLDTLYCDADGDL